ncbi:MAG: protein kinase [Anaerolineae bacterium]
MFAATTIGKRYILHEELGKGGMGVVFRATDRLSGQIVALKQVTSPIKDPFATRVGDDDGTAGNEFRLALAREFQMLSTLRHPNIISVLDYGFDAQRQPYFTMDYLHQSQNVLRAASRQTATFKIELMTQMLQALAYLHRRGILHRDLKPANVLVSEDRVRVLDFGLAIVHSEQLPQQNQAAGTLAYMAPEVLQGADASVASDLYAVGLMSYEMFAGRYPYKENDFQEMLNQIIHMVPDVEKLDLDEPLQMVLERLLAKSPTARYSSAAEVITELNKILIGGRQTITVETPAIRESFLQAAKFVGRAAELEQLGEALAMTIVAKGSAWLIGGESGVGKTRLLEELRTLGLVKGAFVLRGQNVSDGGRPYEMWRDVLRRLAMQTDLQDGEAAVLKPLLPDIAQLLGREIPDAVELDPKAAQERLINVIVGIFRNQFYPILLILEDMHWVGSESIAILQQLMAIADDLPLMIVASFRDDEKPELKQELSAMRLMKLARLAYDAIAQLTESMLGEAGRRERVVQFIERETEGNVFFMVEVVRALAEEVGQMDQIGLRTLPQRVVAGGIERVVRRRLNRVPDDAWKLLEAAAIAGRELDLNILRALTESHEIPFAYTSLDKWLVACSEIAVLDVQHESWRFAHDKLRENLLREMADAHKQALHRAVAQAIEAVYPNDVSRAAVLAYHWGAAEDTEKTAYHATRAGTYALRTGAGVQAKALCEQAIAALGKLPDTPDNQRMLVDATLDLSRAGVYFANPDFPMILGRALQASEGLQDEERMARIYGAAGTFYYSRGQVGEGLGYFARSMTLAEKLGIEELLVMPYNNIGRAVMVSGDLPRAEAMLSRGIPLAEKFNDPDLFSGSLAWYAYAIALQGRLSEALPHFERALTIAKESNELARVVLATVIRGTVYYHCGCLDEARQDLIEARKLAEALNSEIQLVNILGTLGCVEVLSGNIAEATVFLDRCLFLAQKMNAAIGLPDFMVRRAEVELALGKPQEALALAQRALALAETTRQHGIKSLVMRVLAHIYANLPQPDYEQAETLLKNSISSSEPGNVQTFIAISRLELAQLYMTLKRKDDARSELDAALATFQQVGMPHYLARAQQMIDTV